jgi:hypothetical protein
MRRRVQAPQHVDREPRFLRQVADEEIHLRELPGGYRLALELVHALDVAADDDAVRATGEADLSGHHSVELTAVCGEHVHGRDRTSDLAFVQLGPVLVFADREANLEPVVLEEVRVVGRLETAVRRDDPGVAGVLADFDRHDVVSDLHRRGR